jgi:hypothetical protein
MDGFFELFQPGYKHLREERDRKRLEAQIPETGAPPFGIDLDAGVARISLAPAAEQHDQPATELDPDDVGDR